MGSNPTAADYANALEINADNSWAGEFSSRARTQVMNAESLGSYQRPPQVFKYMHLHEFMKGKAQNGPAGALGAGVPHVREGNRRLHRTRKAQEDAEKQDSARNASGDQQEGDVSHRSAKGRSRRSKHGDDSLASDDRARSTMTLQNDFLNKGYYVWEAVRREWRGSPEQRTAAKAKLNNRMRDDDLVEQLRNEMEDSDCDSFTEPVPLPELLEVLDDRWQNEQML